MNMGKYCNGCMDKYDMNMNMSTSKYCNECMDMYDRRRLIKYRCLVYAKNIGEAYNNIIYKWYYMIDLKDNEYNIIIKAINYLNDIKLPADRPIINYIEYGLNSKNACPMSCIYKLSKLLAGPIININYKLGKDAIYNCSRLYIVDVSNMDNYEKCGLVKICG